jgi:hypothetical protein
MSDLYERLPWHSVPADARRRIAAALGLPADASPPDGPAVALNVPVLPEDALTLIVYEAVHGPTLVRSRSYLREGRLVRSDLDTVELSEVEDVRAEGHATVVAYQRDGERRDLAFTAPMAAILQAARNTLA